MLMHGDHYGLEIYHLILARTESLYELKLETLYSSYKRLENGGYITSYWGDESQGARRKYYQITAKGRELYRQNLLNWEFAQEILNKLLR